MIRMDIEGWKIEGKKGWIPVRNQCLICFAL